MQRFGVTMITALVLAGAAQAQQAARTSMGGGLTRRLSNEERAFLGRPLARVVKALNEARAAKGLKPCTIDRSQGADLAKPETLVGARARLTEFGAVPGRWDLGLECERHFLLKLSPEAYVPEEREKQEGAQDTKRGGLVFAAGHRIVERGENFVLVESSIFDSKTETLYVGEIRALPEEVPKTPPGLLATPKSAEFFDSEGAGVLRKAIDVAAVTKALRTEEKPPPMPKRAEEKPGPARDEAARKADELSVYATLLKSADAKGEVVVAAMTARQEIPPDSGKVLTQAAPDLFPSVVEDFAAQNRESKAFPEAPLPGVPKVVRIGDEEMKKFFGRRDKEWDGWKEFRKVHGAVPIHTFSRIGFSRDGSQAMVYDAWQGDWLAGEGRIVVLTRTADGWRELYEIPLWVS